MTSAVLSADTPAGRLDSVERALQELEARFRLTVEGICDGLTIIEAGQVVFVSDRLCEILGYSKEELTRVSSLDLAAPEEAERLRGIMQEVLEKDLPLDRLEFWAVRKDGTRCYIRNRYYTGHNGEGFPRRLVVTTDITEQKLAQKTLLESLQRRDREMQITTDRRRDRVLHAITRELLGRLPGLGDPETIARTAVRELGTTLKRPVFIRLGSAEDLAHEPSEWAGRQGAPPGGGGLGQREEPRAGTLAPDLPITGGE